MLFFEFELTLEVLQASATVVIVIVDTIRGRMDDLMDPIDGYLCSLILHVLYVHTVMWL